MSSFQFRASETTEAAVSLAAASVCRILFCVCLFSDVVFSGINGFLESRYVLHFVLTDAEMYKSARVFDSEVLFVSEDENQNEYQRGKDARSDHCISGIAAVKHTADDPGDAEEDAEYQKSPMLHVNELGAGYLGQVNDVSDLRYVQYTVTAIIIYALIGNVSVFSHKAFAARKVGVKTV